MSKRRPRRCFLAAAVPLVVGSMGPATVAAAADGCIPGLHLIAARGTLEAPGTGVIGTVADAVAAAVPGSEVVPLAYPATYRDYPSSEAAGVVALALTVQGLVNNCSGARIALLGYSQGAQVTADYLCGGSGGIFNSDPPALSSIILNNVVAAVMMGDPSHIANRTWDVGSSVNDGIFVRTNTTACQGYAPRMRSYCDTGDVYCDSGHNQTVHMTYWKTYRADAVEFITGRFSNASNETAPSGSPTSTGSPQPSSTSSATATPSSKSGAGPVGYSSLFAGFMLLLITCILLL